MVTRYVWWDEKQRVERIRTELRIPEPLHEWASRVAKVHGVSLNAFVTGLIAYAADSESHRKLRVEVIPAVRVTEVRPSGHQVDLTVPAADPATAKRYDLPKAR